MKASTIERIFYFVCIPLMAYLTKTTESSWIFVSLVYFFLALDILFAPITNDWIPKLKKKDKGGKNENGTNENRT